MYMWITVDKTYIYTVFIQTYVQYINKIYTSLYTNYIRSIDLIWLISSNKTWFETKSALTLSYACITVV